MVRCAILTCSILIYAAASSAQQMPMTDWRLVDVAAREPLEMAADWPLEEQALELGYLLTISREGDGTRLDYYQVHTSGSISYEARIPGSSFIFGLSHKTSGGQASYIDDGSLKVTRLENGVPRADTISPLGANAWVESQIDWSMTPRGSFIAAVDLRSRRAHLFEQTGSSTWRSLGAVPTGMIHPTILGSARMTFAVDKEGDSFTLGWPELTGEALRYYVQSFSLPLLQPQSAKIEMPITFPRSDHETEAQMQMFEDGMGAVVTTDAQTRYRFALFDVKSGATSAVDLGPAPHGITGGVALATSGPGTVYVAVADDRGVVNPFLVFSTMFRLGIPIDPEPLPTIPTRHIIDPSQADTIAALPRIFPMSMGVYGASGQPRRIQLRMPGSVRIAEYRGCANSFRRLCESAHRFDVSATWRDHQGTTGFGRAVPLSGDTGYFWFFNEANVELVVKVLNGCTVNQRQWVFAGGLTDVEVNLTVRDLWTGAVKTYHNPRGRPFAPVLDTGAFAGCSTGPLATPASSFHPSATSTADLPPVASSNCTPSPTTLCVNGNRFRVESRWVTRDGNSGQGRAVRLTEDAGYFWFFNASNVELVVKGLNACGFSGRHWVFAAGLTDVEVEMTVTDTVTGAVKRYRNPQGNPFQPITDTAAFACP